MSGMFRRTGDAIAGYLQIDDLEGTARKAVKVGAGFIACAATLSAASQVPEMIEQPQLTSGDDASVVAIVATGIIAYTSAALGNALRGEPYQR